MALIKCPECGREISDKAPACLHCGYLLARWPNERTDQDARAMEESSQAISPPFTASAPTKSPRKRMKREDLLAIIGGIVLVGGLLVGPNSCDKPENIKLNTEVAESDRQKAALLERFDVLVAQGQFADAYRLATRSPQARDAGVQQRVASIAQQAKSQIDIEEAEKRQKNETELLEQAKALPASEHEKNRDAYALLVDLNPDSKTYREKYAHYDRLVKKSEEERQERIARFGPAPLLNGWDNSYIEVKLYLKRVVADPDSIKIEGCTPVYKTNDGWLVGCTYRGKNAFGGLIQQSNWFTIRHKEVIKMESASVYRPKDKEG